MFKHAPGLVRLLAVNPLVEYGYAPLGLYEPTMYCVPAVTAGGVVNARYRHPGPAATLVDDSVASSVPEVVQTLTVMVPVSSAVLYHQTPGKVPVQVTLTLTPAIAAYAGPIEMVDGGVGGEALYTQS
jgi:hypothetical protein